MHEFVFIMQKGRKLQIPLQSHVCVHRFTAVFPLLGVFNLHPCLYLLFANVLQFITCFNLLLTLIYYLL